MELAVRGHRVRARGIAGRHVRQHAVQRAERLVVDHRRGDRGRLALEQDARLQQFKRADIEFGRRGRLGRRGGDVEAGSVPRLDQTANL